MKRRKSETTTSPKLLTLEDFINSSQYPRLQRSVDLFEDAVYTIRKHRREKCIRNIYSLKCLGQEGIKKLLRIVKGTSKLTKPSTRAVSPIDTGISKLDCHICTHSDCPVHSDNPEYEICIRQCVENVGKTDRMFMCPELDKTVDAIRYPLYIKSLKCFKASLESKKQGAINRTDNILDTSDTNGCDGNINTVHSKVRASDMAPSDKIIRSPDLKSTMSPSKILNKKSSLSSIKSPDIIAKDKHIKSSFQTIPDSPKSNGVRSQMHASPITNNAGLMFARRQMTSGKHQTNVGCSKNLCDSPRLSNIINDLNKSNDAISESDNLLQTYIALNTLVTDRIFSETVLSVGESPKSTQHENFNQNANKKSDGDTNESHDSTVDGISENIDVLDTLPDNAPTPVLDDHYLPTDPVIHMNDIPDMLSDNVIDSTQSSVSFPKIVRQDETGSVLNDAATHILNESQQQMLNYTHNVQQTGWYLIPVFVPETDRHGHLQSNMPSNSLDPRYSTHENCEQHPLNIPSHQIDPRYRTYEHWEQPPLNIPSSSLDPRYRLYDHCDDQSNLDSYNQAVTDVDCGENVPHEYNTQSKPSSSRYSPESNSTSSRLRYRSRSPLRSRPRQGSRSPCKSKSRSRSTSRSSYYRSNNKYQRTRSNYGDRRETRRQNNFDKNDRYRRSPSSRKQPYRSYSNANRYSGRTRSNYSLRARQRRCYSPKRYSKRSDPRR